MPPHPTPLLPPAAELRLWWDPCICWVRYFWTVYSTERRALNIEESGGSYLSCRNRMSRIFAVSYASLWASFIWWFPCSRVAGWHVSTHSAPAPPLLSTIWRRARWCLRHLYCSRSACSRRSRRSQACCCHSRPSQDRVSRWCRRTHRVLDHTPSWEWTRFEL